MLAPEIRAFKRILTNYRTPKDHDDLGRNSPSALHKLIFNHTTTVNTLRTTVSIVGETVHINGQPTNPGSRAEGLLLNARMVQAIFDDANASTRKWWAYTDTGVWNATRNVEEFVAAVPSYAEHGLNAITVGLQGG